MVELLRQRGITDERVLAVFAEVPREDFVVSDTPYADMPLPIGCGQTISQPFVVALTLQALQLRADEAALDVGTGSGYSAALLAKLVKRVVTVERVEALARSRCGGAGALRERRSALRGWHARLARGCAVRCDRGGCERAGTAAEP